MPAALLARVPELLSLEARAGGNEPRADCSRCVMVPARIEDDPGGSWAFAGDLRCCTHHPALPNYLAGHALRRGGASAERVRARLEDRAGVSAWGIRPPRPPVRPIELEQRFGRDPELRCPFWVGGALACGIWPERTGSCRTWFCKHEDGLAGAERWWRMGDVLGALEARLGDFCAAQGIPPSGDAPIDALLDWYVWCAGRVDRFDAGDAERVDLEGLEAPRRDLVQLRARAPRTMPAVLVPAVSDLREDARGVRIAGYSTYDAILAPHAALAFLSRLDGARTWREALADTGPPMDEGLVRELFRIGAIEPRAAS